MRTDLLELNVRILAELANAGLVKRAQRELESGQFGDPDVADDGTVTICTTDANTIVFAPNSGLNGSCTCGAAMCRHRIGSVLRYQAWINEGQQRLSTEVDPTQADSEAQTDYSDAALDGESTSAEATDAETATATDENATADVIGANPTDDPLRGLPSVTDTALESAVATRTITSAKRKRTDGYIATVVRADDDEPCVVELGSATVRFLLGSDLRYARCNCKLRTGCEHIALAGWAVAQARLESEFADSSVVAVGGGADFGRSKLSDEYSGVSVRDAVHSIVELVLTDGIAHLGPAFALRVGAVHRITERAKQQWVSLLLDEVTKLHGAVDHRSAIDIPTAISDVLASLVGRYRAVSVAERPLVERTDYLGLPSAALLGTDERSETALAQIRFTGAGARVSAGPTHGSCSVDVLLVDPATSLLVVCRKVFRPIDQSSTNVPGIGSIQLTEIAQTGPLVANRSIVKGAAVRTMAVGGVVTNAAVRRANRTVDFRVGGLRRTSILSGGAAPTRFHDAGLVSEPSEIIRAHTSAPPLLLRPMLVTDSIAAVELQRCEFAGFDAGEQKVVAAFITPNSERVRIEVAYRDLAPNGPAALALVTSLFTNEAVTGIAIGHTDIDNGEVVMHPTFLGVMHPEEPLNGQTGASVTETVIVPDLFAGSQEAAEALASLPIHRVAPAESGVRQTVIRTKGCVDELAMRGTRNAGSLDRELESCASELAVMGLSVLADHIRVLGGAVRAAAISGPSDQLVDQWATAAIALRLAAEAGAGAS